MVGHDTGGDDECAVLAVRIEVEALKKLVEVVVVVGGELRDDFIQLSNNVFQRERKTRIDHRGRGVAACDGGKGTRRDQGVIDVEENGAQVGHSGQGSARARLRD